MDACGYHFCSYLTSDIESARECVTSPESPLQSVYDSHAHPVGGRTRRISSAWPPGGRLRSRPSPEERGRLGSEWPAGEEHRQTHRCYFPKKIENSLSLLSDLPESNISL